MTTCQMCGKNKATTEWLCILCCQDCFDKQLEKEKEKLIEEIDGNKKH